MQRLVFIVVIALFGGVALTGCGRSQPDVAAYVGNKQFTIEQVEALAKELGDRVGDYSQTQRLVVGWLVIESVGQRMKGLDIKRPPDAEVDEFAVQSGLKAGSPVANLYLKTVAVLQALDQTVLPVDPIDTEQREVYDNLRINGEPVQEPFDTVQQFLTKETIGRALAVRQALVAELKKSDVVVNPRYTPMRYPIELRVGQVPGFVYLALDDGSVASGTR